MDETTIPPLLEKARKLQTLTRPEGERGFGLFGPECVICRGGPLDTETWQQRTTYGTVRGKQGLFDIQTHKGWCPLLSPPDPGPCCCPECGARVTEFEYMNGFRAVVRGRQEAAGTWDDIADQTGRVPVHPERCPGFDVMKVGPCGHAIEGEQGLALRRALLQAWQEDQQHGQR